MTRLENKDSHMFWADVLHANLRSWISKEPSNKLIYTPTGLWLRLWIIFGSTFYRTGEKLG